MTSDRTYRPAMSMEMAVNEIKMSKGSQFDPVIADIFIEMISQIIINEEVEFVS
jgi:HD-GYP domain-containing protein (c-di-GMP phosphodiesterase class II)